jgi:hypothetical protein
LASNNKAGLHHAFWNSLIEFLHTDLDGNLSSNLNPQISSKLDHYLARLLEGLSETRSKGKMFNQHLLNEKMQRLLHQKDSGHFATKISPSIFTNLFHQRFEKHSMLESTLEILQQIYIQMETEPDDFHLFPADLSIYITVYQMWAACYFSWFNWTNSIPCTRCNVISLEHDSTP